MTHFFIFHSIF